MKKEMKELLVLPVPKSLIRKKSVGEGKPKLDYVSGQYIIKMLNFIFGPFNWEWHVIERWKEPGFKSKEKEVAHVYGVLTVNDVDENNKVISTVKKEGYGSKVINNMNDQENSYKSANTDALKKAATLLGIALDLAMNDEEIDYFNDLEYENPWTEELIEKFQTELSWLDKIKSQYSEEVLCRYIYGFSDGISESENFITPQNIKNFIAFIKKHNNKGKK